jgi:hypothetical protein
VIEFNFWGLRMNRILFEKSLRGHLCFVIFYSFLQNFENIYAHGLWSLIVINCDVYVSMKKNIFLCVAYGHYPNMF